MARRARKNGNTGDYRDPNHQPVAMGHQERRGGLHSQTGPRRMNTRSAKKKAALADWR